MKNTVIITLHFMLLGHYSLLTNQYVFTVPLVVIFTKFDGLITQELAKLDDMKDWNDRLKKAEDNANKTFQLIYEDSVMNTEYPPKVYVQLGGGTHLQFMEETKIMFDRYGQVREELSRVDSGDCKCN